MTLRVFVSHSAKEPAALAVQTALVRELEKAASRQHFTLLMDKYTLKPGDAWRAQINLWLGACDVAVVLLSPAALESAYVLYELSVLSYRAATSAGAFRILPIYLAGVAEEQLKKSRLDPMQLTEIQSLRAATPAATAVAVVTELARCAALPQRPVDKLVQTIKTKLARVPEHVLDLAAARLALDLPWQPDSDKVGRLALRLLSVGMEAAIPALLEIRQALKNDPDTMRELAKLVACSWVDLKAIEQLPRVASAAAGRALALNASAYEVARMYHVAASGGRDTWRLIDATNVCAEPRANETFAGALSRQVGDVLRATLHLRPGEDLRRALRALTKYDHVVLVAMPWQGLDAACVEQLQQDHPNVTFFFLTGQAAADIPVDESLMQLIIPQLQDGEEEAFLDSHYEFDVAVLLPLRGQEDR